MIGIRRASVKDLDAINDLTVEMHNHLGALVGIKFSIEELKEEMYEDEEGLENTYVAESDGRVVGYMTFSRNVEENEFFGKYYHLYHIVVNREFRGKGIAAKLFNMLQRKAKLENVNIVCGTLCLNEEALEFYQRMGFKPIQTTLIIDNLKRLKPLNREA